MGRKRLPRGEDVDRGDRLFVRSLDQLRHSYGPDRRPREQSVARQSRKFSTLSPSLAAPHLSFVSSCASSSFTFFRYSNIWSSFWYWKNSVRWFLRSFQILVRHCMCEHCKPFQNQSNLKWIGESLYWISPIFVCLQITVEQSQHNSSKLVHLSVSGRIAVRDWHRPDGERDGVFSDRRRAPTTFSWRRSAGCCWRATSSTSCSFKYSSRKNPKYSCISCGAYGFPAVIVAVSAGVAWQNYGTVN